jgi:hypothetical protein
MKAGSDSGLLLFDPGLFLCVAAKFRDYFFERESGVFAGEFAKTPGAGRGFLMVGLR